MINRLTNYSDNLYQPVTTLAKTRTFVWVQRKVSKHIHLKVKEDCHISRKLNTLAQTQNTSDFQFIKQLDSKCKQLTKSYLNDQLTDSLN